jgi:hypothetical protein
MINPHWLNGTFHGRQIVFQKEAPRAERPTYTLGEKWIRYDGVYELIRIEDDRYIFATGNKREIHLTKDLVVAKIVRAPYLLELDPPPALKWPLEVGKWGSSAASWRSELSPGSGWPVTMTWRVVAYEDIEVAAGRYKAFRVAWSVEFPGGKKRELLAWYAPEVQQFVRAAGHDMSLLPFEVVAIRGGAEPLEIVLQQPEDGARLASESIVVTGKVKTGRRLERVVVTVNGEAVSTGAADAEGGPLQGELALQVPVRLQEGKNVVLVTAEDSSGETRQEARVLFYERLAPAPSTALRPTEPQPTKPATALPAVRPLEPEPPTVAIKPAPVPVPVKPADDPPKVAAPVVAPTLMGKPAVPTSPTPLPPFLVTLSSPRDQVRVEHESVGLAGLVTGGEGVQRVVVTLNGIEVSRLEERAAQPAFAVNLPVKLREGQNTLVVTATETHGKIHQEVRTVHYEKLVPLSIAFQYPENQARITEEASVVAAVVTSSKGVAKVLNGTEIHEQNERAPQKSVVVTVPVAFREGANAIVLSAAEPDGTVRQELRTVIYERPKLPAVAPLPSTPRPAPADRWAVVIGIGRYENSDIPTLRYAVPDANAIYQVLTGSAGFKKEHVLLLTDMADKKPTLRNLKWALGTFLARSAKKQDTVLIFFAGHGAPEVDPRGVERDGLAKYLVPIDAEPDDLYSTGLPMDELQNIFSRIEAERVVVFLDSCYSGAAGGRTFTSKKTRASYLDDLFLERLARSKGRAIITASRPTEVSLELAELGHGIFSYYLIEGLKGAADLNRDGIVVLQELYEYVEQQVAQKSRAVGGNQHPMMKGELEGLLPLMKVSGQ